MVLPAPSGIKIIIIINKTDKIRKSITILQFGTSKVYKTNSKSKNSADRECSLACRAEDTGCVVSHKADDGTSEDPSTPHLCCRRGSRALAGTLSECRRTAWPSAGPSPPGLAPAGCRSRSPSPVTSPPAVT